MKGVNDDGVQYDVLLQRNPFTLLYVLSFRCA
jgi:hypothetical protein